MAELYRLGGPIPEAVLALRARRRSRDSESFAALKKIRRERAEEERAAQCKCNREPSATLRLIQCGPVTPVELLRQTQADGSSSLLSPQQEGRDTPEQKPMR